MPDGSIRRKELIKLGGKEQVPFLVDTEKNVKMYESEDIINYVRENYGK
jgi:glutaredoxin 2